jgi:hypothetical protein
MVRTEETSQETSAEANGKGKDHAGYIEIGGLSQTRRWVGFLTYALLIAGVCTVLVVLFVRFTGSMRLALVLVVFMVSYMLLMGWWASRGDQGGR